LQRVDRGGRQNEAGDPSLRGMAIRIARFRDAGLVQGFVVF